MGLSYDDLVGLISLASIFGGTNSFGSVISPNV